MDYYDASSNDLRKIIDHPTPVRLEPFRSGGFINKECDMARISFCLPLVDAKKLMSELKSNDG